MSETAKNCAGCGFWPAVPEPGRDAERIRFCQFPAPPWAYSNEYPGNPMMLDIQGENCPCWKARVPT